jgi:hypothetical protein
VISARRVSKGLRPAYAGRMVAPSTKWGGAAETARPVAPEGQAPMRRAGYPARPIRRSPRCSNRGDRMYMMITISIGVGN